MKLLTSLASAQLLYNQMFHVFKTNKEYLELKNYVPENWFISSCVCPLVSRLRAAIGASLISYSDVNKSAEVRKLFPTYT